jgi:hypothetical protein
MDLSAAREPGPDASCDPDDVAEVMAALASPSRLEIVRVLADTELDVGEIAQRHHSPARNGRTAVLGIAVLLGGSVGSSAPCAVTGIACGSATSSTRFASGIAKRSRRSGLCRRRRS